MKFTLQIDMSNAAFDNPERELISIFNDVIQRLDLLDFDTESAITLYDSNGNRVGLACVKSDE